MSFAKLHLYGAVSAPQSWGENLSALCGKEIPRAVPAAMISGMADGISLYVEPG